MSDKTLTVMNTLTIAMSLISCVGAISQHNWALAGAWFCSALGWLGMINERYSNK